MLLLALDSAEAACSAALWDSARPAPEALLGHRARSSAARGQADRLIELVESWCWPRGLDYGALGVIAVEPRPRQLHRPAQRASRRRAGWRWRPACRCSRSSSLEALAAARARTRRRRRCVAALDARRGQVYVQRFDRPRTAAAQPRHAAVDAAGWPRPGCRPGRSAWSAAAPRWSGPRCPTGRPAVIETRRARRALGGAARRAPPRRGRAAAAPAARCARSICGRPMRARRRLWSAPARAQAVEA